MSVENTLVPKIIPLVMTLAGFLYLALSIWSGWHH